LNLSRYQKYELTDGTILWCRVVPPYAQAEAHNRFPEPPVPNVDVMGSGNKEKHKALPGTPEYDAYVRAHKEYRRELGLAIQRFAFNYGVIAWRFPGELPEDDPHTEPPEDWKLPGIMDRYGAKNREGPDRRGQYILYELILTESDMDGVERVILPTRPVSKEDVAAALAPFESSTKDND